MLLGNLCWTWLSVYINYYCENFHNFGPKCSVKVYIPMPDSQILCRFMKWIIFKLDFVKIYDRVSNSFLDKVMQFNGVEIRYRKWNF